jgi:hypothetical protein
MREVRLREGPVVIGIVLTVFTQNRVRGSAPQIQIRRRQGYKFLQMRMPSVNQKNRVDREVLQNAKKY